MAYLLVKNGLIVNQSLIEQKDILIKNDRIIKVEKDISHPGAKIIEAKGLHILPGVIDDQVHFREPGLTHKANIYSESKAAVAGGITSFMEMPNTVPNTLTQKLLQDKYDIAKKNSLANYSFYMGASNDNIEEVLKTNRKDVCGVKVFMGSSTGNMLVDSEQTLNNIFSKCDLLIATHCEDEQTVRNNLEVYKNQFGDDIPIKYHPIIRNEEACYLSSSLAVNLAKKHNTRLHILHISTAKELELFTNEVPLIEKRITAEACIHHLWFEDSDYDTKGTFIKWNPAVKTKTDRDTILNAVINDTIDVIATDHAPHTLKEKQNVYTKAPSGGPLVQHALPAMLELVKQEQITLTHVVKKMCHDVADCFQIEDRGYIKEGYFADLTLVDLNNPWEVSKANVLYKCGWSPFEGQQFGASINTTIVSGHVAYQNGQFDESQKGKRLTFIRQ